MSSRQTSLHSFFQPDRPSIPQTSRTVPTRQNSEPPDNGVADLFNSLFCRTGNTANTRPAATGDTASTSPAVPNRENQAGISSAMLIDPALASPNINSAIDPALSGPTCRTHPVSHTTSEATPCIVSNRLDGVLQTESTAFVCAARPTGRILVV